MHVLTIFSSYFFLTTHTHTHTKKKDNSCINSQDNIVCGGHLKQPYPLLLSFKIIKLIFWSYSFKNIYQRPSPQLTKLEKTKCRNHPESFGISLKDNSCHISKHYRDLSLEFNVNLLSKLHVPPEKKILVPVQKFDLFPGSS